VTVLPFSKFQKKFYFLRLPTSKADIVVCTDDYYTCQYDIKQIYFIATRIFFLNVVILNVPTRYTEIQVLKKVVKNLLLVDFRAHALY
jgi:hypothetical protein